MKNNLLKSKIRKSSNKVITTVYIHDLYFPIDGIYKYDAQVFRSIDGGKTFYHCGEGRYCKTYKEARDYKAKIESQNK